MQTLKRRQFLETTAAVAATGLGVATAVHAQAATPEVIRFGHLAGIGMSPLFYGHATGMFTAEGLNVELKFVPNPGDGLVGFAVDKSPGCRRRLGAAPAPRRFSR